MDKIVVYIYIEHIIHSILVFLYLQLMSRIIKVSHRWRTYSDIITKNVILQEVWHHHTKWWLQYLCIKYAIWMMSEWVLHIWLDHIKRRIFFFFLKWKEGNMLHQESWVDHEKFKHIYFPEFLIWLPNLLWIKKVWVGLNAFIFEYIL